MYLPEQDMIDQFLVVMIYLVAFLSALLVVGGIVNAIRWIFRGGSCGRKDN